jgi:site-specific DNA-cytosine methylase
MSELSHLELFSGIGGFHRAFDLLGIDHNKQLKHIKQITMLVHQ